MNWQVNKKHKGNEKVSRKDERMKGWKDERNERMNERIKGWKDESMKGWKDEKIKGWKEWWMKE